MAGLGGFERPILHGLCSYGFTARVIYEKYCNNNPTALAKYGARFTSHVFPGESLVVEIWKEGNKLIFQSKTKERGKVVLRGYADLKDQPKL